MELDTIVDLTTAAIAVGAFVLSVVNFRLTGSHVKVVAHPDMQIVESGTAGPKKYISVTAYNDGRMQVGIDTLGVKSASGANFAVPLPIGPPLPYLLGAGLSVRWLIDQDDLRKAVPPEDVAKPLKIAVFTATRKKREAKVTLPPSG